MSQNNTQSFMKALLSPKMLICIFNGFVSGLPLYYLYQLIPAWLRSENVDLKTIGLFALVGLPYNWKFLWSPLFDHFKKLPLGRRRFWMLTTQILCFLTMCYYAFLNPTLHISAIASTAFLLAFFSASQDVVLDAYRRELLNDNELGLGNSFYMNGYRVAGLIPGGLGLILADLYSWSTVHIMIAGFMFVGVIKTLLIKEPDAQTSPKQSFIASVWLPLKEFFNRESPKKALLILSFLFLYKLGDNMATALATPFYLDLGFSKALIGSLVKVVSLWSMIIGSFFGGWMIFRWGINKCLWLFGLVQMASIFGFALLNEIVSHHNLMSPMRFLFSALSSNTMPTVEQLLLLQNKGLLSFVIGFEYLGVGLGSAALIAFMSRSTSKQFTATQFALFSSLIALPRTFANASTGFLIEGVNISDGLFYTLLGSWSGLGYTNFFLLCGALAIPGLLLLPAVAPWNSVDE